MTNYEKIISLPKEELAWIHMNNVTSAGDNGCDLCVWKHYSHECGEMSRSCIQGHLDFLNREITEEDTKMYAIARNNVVVGKHNAMSNKERMEWDVIYENGYAVRLEKRGDTDET